MSAIQKMMRITAAFNLQFMITLLGNTVGQNGSFLDMRYN